MNLIEIKSLIEKVKNIVSSSPGRKIGIKYTYVDFVGPFLRITHTARAEDGNIQSIDERLQDMDLPTTQEMREFFEVYSEKGNPASHYILMFRLKAIDRNKVRQAKAQKMNNIPNSIKI